jgi:hypothetical protein
MRIDANLRPRSIGKFLFNEGNKFLNVLSRFHSVYENMAMRQIQVDFWIRKVHGRRKDLCDEGWPRKPPDISRDEVLAHRIETRPHTTVRKLDHSLGSSPQTVVEHLRDGMGMTRVQLHCIPYTLTAGQKVNQVPWAENIECPLMLYPNPLLIWQTESKSDLIEIMDSLSCFLHNVNSPSRIHDAM